MDEKTYHKDYLVKWRKLNPTKSREYWESESSQKWYKEYSSTEERKTARRDTRYKNRYGITLNDYNIMYKLQNGLCAICNQPPKPTQRLYIDHNHNSNRVRQLLCQGCNSGLGYFKEDSELLIKASEYIIRHSKEDG